MLNFLQKIFLFCIVVFGATFNAFAEISYPEYKLLQLPSNVNTIYLQDALRYLSLTVAEEQVIDATFSEDSQTRYKLVTFPDSGIRVLMIYDQIKNTQIINFASLKSSENLVKSLKVVNRNLVQGKLFRFPISAYHNSIYNDVRQEVIKNVVNGAIVQINTIGITSAYGSLLAIELSELQNPIESILHFGATRFTTQDAHNYITKKFSGVVLNISHEQDINHQIDMGHNIASLTLDEYVICDYKKCYEKIYQQKSFSKKILLNHISAFPHQYIAMYHDSLVKIL